MKDRVPIQEHLSSFNSIVNKLVALDVRIDEEEKASILLCSMPESWDNLIINLSHVETLKMESIVVSLVTEKMQRKSSQGSSSGEAMIAREKTLRERACTACPVVGVGDVRIKIFDGVVRTVSNVRPALRKVFYHLECFANKGLAVDVVFKEGYFQGTKEKQDDETMVPIELFEACDEVQAEQAQQDNEVVDNEPNLESPQSSEDTNSSVEPPADFRRLRRVIRPPARYDDHITLFTPSANHVNACVALVKEDGPNSYKKACE
uniref:Retrovirus-related Pol polyprotein from transposon TNT 1-94 n=1 Tax=Ananas comosus var. bracteatus TaxID=296719 RepID=A0A6V7PRX8_ANACO|nr:unnamed protein product [Ananas comosus var. bracteatus]